MRGFANDTHFVLDPTLDNLLVTKNLLQDFGVASGLTIQWTKSEARWLAQHPRPSNLDCLGWDWKPLNYTNKFIGFLFSADIVPKVLHNFLVKKIKAKLAFWSTF